VIYKDVVIVILEYLSTEIISRWYIDFVIKKKETKRVSLPTVFRIGKIFYNRSIFLQA